MTEPPRMTREEFEAQRAERRKADEKAQREAREAQEKEAVRREYLSAGGSPEEFEKAYPGIRAQILEAEVLERHEAARNASRQHVRSMF